VRIAVIASPVTPLRPAQLGGAQAFVCDLARGLADRGHEVTLHCAAGSEVPGVKLVMVPAPADATAALVMPGGAEPPAAPGVAAAITRMFGDVRELGADVVSQHAFDAPALEQSRGLPVLHTLHLPPIVGSVVGAARATHARHLATVSRACRDDWRRAGVEVTRILANGVPDLPVEESPGRGVLVAGRISPEKGIEHAIAAARAAGRPVRLAGAQYDPSYGVDLAGVEVLGSLARDRLRQLMAGSAVTVCAVRWQEPFGMVAAEAQMAGCPVAAYRRGALPEVVEEGVSGFLAAPDDINELAQAIRRCLALDRAEVRASALRRLGMGAAVERYEVALEEVAG
jgi:UDP-glucose:tetrahydrobiopterin glucosyltransferase